MFVKYALKDNQVINIQVAEGTSKPYYIKSKGLKPSGVYVRQDASSVPVSAEQIRQMIKLSDGDVYETARSLEQELTFNEAAGTFNIHKIPFGEDKFVSLGIHSLNDNLYTNLAKILSDQCEHTIKIAVFSDDANTIFNAHREFSGSVFTQMESAYDYLMLCNQNKSEFTGINRIDKWDYPAEAIREALLNAFVHRDYSYSGSIIVNVNNSCMEFISLGGLVNGLSEDDMKSGISQPRNSNLASVFHRLNFIESYGTGIRKIYALYADHTEQPQIIVTSNTFKIILPNMNVSPTIKSSELTPQMKVVLDYLAKNGEMTEDVMQKLPEVKRTRAYAISKEMVDKGLIHIVGKGANKKFVI